MNNKMNFQPEAFPLEVLTGQSEDSSEFVFEGDELEEERRGGAPFRQGFSARRRSPAQSGGARRRPRPPQRPGRLRPARPRRRWPYVAWPVGGGVTWAGGGSEQIRWAQDCLNRALSLTLPVDGTMSAATRSAIRSFQQQQGLTPTGIMGPDTEDALKRACSATGEPPSVGAPGPDAAATDGADTAGDAGAAGDAGGGDQEFFGNIADRIGSGVSNVFDWVAGALDNANVIDLTASADKSQRKGTRDPKTVYALVLHQMACCFAPADPLKRFLTVGAHFAITNDGRILQLHPVSVLLWASNGFNERSVAVEFAGNFPSTSGRWWEGEKFGKNRPTAAQVTAGRQLIRHLMRTMGLTHVLAHRQSSGTRENDPGPDIWFDVGQWAVNTLGLKDGGPAFRIGTGNPIPEEWRTWGSRRPAVTPEMELEHELAMPETELAHDVWDLKQYGDSGKEPIMHNTRCGCPRCARARIGSFGAEPFSYGSPGGFAGEMESEMSEEEEMELALELMAVSSEAELDQFLGKLLKGAWKGIKKVGSVVGKIARPLGGVLKSIAKTALPLVGGALGSFIPIPGVGTAVGSALGGAISKALEMETESMSGEDRELEIARRFVRIATAAARQAAAAPFAMDGELAANQAVTAAARKYLPRFQFDASGTTASAGAQQGRWIRHGHEVVLLGA